MRVDVTVEPLFERYADSVAGPFYVIKGHCLICGLPEETAPANITWTPNTCDDCSSHCRVERQPETDDEIAQMIEAACASCVQAIRYCGTDPEIIKRFREGGCEHLCDAVVRKKAEQVAPGSPG